MTRLPRRKRAGDQTVVGTTTMNLSNYVNTRERDPGHHCGEAIVACPSVVHNDMGSAAK